MIKIELNYSLRAHIFEPTYRSIVNDAFKSDIKIRTVTPLEIFAGERDLFRKCFAFYTTISADKAQINRNFDSSAIDLLDFTKIRRDLFPVISRKDNFRLEERKKQAKQYIYDLMQLTEKENEYMDRFMANEYCPELLFDDEEIVARICEHPMALWKCKS